MTASAGPPCPSSQAQLDRALAGLLVALTPEEMRYIAGRDHGVHADRHLEALRAEIERGGRFVEGEQWYPYEVVELCAHAFEPGHAREFAVCTVLVIAAVVTGFDGATELASKYAHHAADYDALAPDLQATVLAAYAAAGL